MVELPSLETFVTVARLGSLKRAAERLHRTQPSLSARLAILESGWGTRLFRRHARGMALTPEGSRLLPLAEAALAAIDALDGAAGRATRERGELRLGSGDALGREVVPRALARLLRLDPGLPVRLVEGPAARLLEAVRSGEIDIALVAEGAATPPPAGIASKPFLRSRVVLLAPAGEARPRRPLPLRALRERRIVTLQPGSAFRRHIEEAFAAAKVPFRPAVEVGNLSLVRRFVAAGLGVAPVPAVAFPEDDPAGRVATLSIAGFARIGYAIARRDGVPLAGPAAKFVELLI